MVLWNSLPFLQPRVGLSTVAGIRCSPLQRRGLCTVLYLRLRDQPPRTPSWQDSAGQPAVQRSSRLELRRPRGPWHL